MSRFLYSQADFPFIGSRAILNCLKSFMSCVSTALLFVFLASPYTLWAQSQASAPSAPVLRSAYGEKLKFAGLPNGGKISDSLFRGAQPRAEGFDQLRNLGITTIVDLRGEDAGKVAWERQQAESRGIRFVNIPLSGWSPPTNEQIAQFLSLFKNEHEKVFVHCRWRRPYGCFRRRLSHGARQLDPQRHHQRNVFLRF